MGKQILKHKKMKKTYIPKIILHNYILYKGDPTYVGTFPVDSGMPLILQISSTAHGADPLPVGRSVNIKFTGKVPT